MKLLWTMLTGKLFLIQKKYRIPLSYCYPITQPLLNQIDLTRLGFYFFFFFPDNLSTRFKLAILSVGDSFQRLFSHLKKPATMYDYRDRKGLTLGYANITRNTPPSRRDTQRRRFRF